MSNISAVSLYGIPFSTFTRSIRMAYRELGGEDGKLSSASVSIDTPLHLIDAAPHSDEVNTRNPFGLLPVLELPNKDGPSTILIEGNAIRRWVDRRSHQILSTAGLDDESQDAHHVLEKVDMWVSIASSTLFRSVEHGVIKPRLSAEEQGKTEQEIVEAGKEGVQAMQDVLQAVEKLLAEARERAQGSKEYTQDTVLSIGKISWADLFLYPALADLRAIPEASHCRRFLFIEAFTNPFCRERLLQERALRTLSSPHGVTRWKRESLRNGRTMERWPVSESDTMTLCLPWLRLLQRAISASSPTFPHQREFQQLKQSAYCLLSPPVCRPASVSSSCPALHRCFR